MRKLELFYDIVVPAIPFFSDITKEAKEKWGDEIGSVIPSFFPESGDIFEIFKAEKNGHAPNTNNCIKHLKVKNLFLPNVYGLLIAEALDIEHGFLPTEVWVMGIDYSHHLSYKKTFGHLVPFLKKNEERTYSYHWFPYGTKLDHDEMIFGFRRKK